MLESWVIVLAFAAALGSGLVAGVFFAFSTFVMQALGRQPPAAGIAAMQAINVTVINPWFMAVFLGTAALGVVLGAAAVVGWDRAGAPWRLAGGLLYVMGAFGVTIACNVPRNNALAGVDAQSPAGAAAWTAYRREWTAWNHVRAAAAAAACLCFILGLRLSPA